MATSSYQPNLITHFQRKVEEINQLYGFKDPVGVKDFRIMTENPTVPGSWEAHLRFEDGCNYIQSFSKEDYESDSVRVMEIGMWAQSIIVKHGWRPIYSSELHNKPKWSGHNA